MEVRRHRNVLAGFAWHSWYYAELAAVPAVEHVHRQPDDQPYEETQPCQDWQAGHQHHAEQHAQDGRCDTTRRSEPAPPPRLRGTQDYDADRHQDKREERTDIRQIRGRADGEKPAGNADPK